MYVDREKNRRSERTCIWADWLCNCYSEAKIAREGWCRVDHFIWCWCRSLSLLLVHSPATSRVDFLTRLSIYGYQTSCLWKVNWLQCRSRRYSHLRSTWVMLFRDHPSQLPFKHITTHLFANTLLAHLADSSTYTHHLRDPFQRWTDQSHWRKILTNLCSHLYTFSYVTTYLLCQSILLCSVIYLNVAPGYSPCYSHASIHSATNLPSFTQLQP